MKDDSSLMRKDHLDLLDWHDQEQPAKQASADSERIWALHARAETQFRDEADPTVGGIDPEAFRAVKPVIAIDRAWTVVLSVGHPLLDSGRD